MSREVLFYVAPVRPHQLRTNQVIVMDNASCHAVKAKHISNVSLRKNVLLKWLMKIALAHVMLA
jgi:hypothetical protein